MYICRGHCSYSWYSLPTNKEGASNINMTSHTHNTNLPLSGPPLLHAAHVECLPEVHLDHGCQAIGCHVPHNSELVAKETTQSWEQRQQLKQDKTRRHHTHVHNPKCQQMQAAYQCK